MAPNRKILFFTNSEYGQCNVILATAHELALRPDTEVYVASFPFLSERVVELNQSLLPQKILFRTLSGPSMKEAVAAKGRTSGSMLNPPTIKGALATYADIKMSLCSWDGPAYLTIVEDCMALMKDIDPHAIVVEVLFSQGVDACTMLGRKYIGQSPSTLRELTRGKESPWKEFCRYPTICSGLAYPVPWHQIPTNIYLIFRLILSILLSPVLSSFRSFRSAHSLPTLIPLLEFYQPSQEYLVVSAPGSDFPCTLRSNVTLCGPVLLPSLPLHEADPELEAWMRGGGKHMSGSGRGTVLVNFGTAIQLREGFVLGVAGAIRLLLERMPELRVLWKLKKAEEEGVDKRVRALLAAQLTDGKIRIVEWLAVEPAEVVKSEYVVCSVHHAAAGAYHEAISAGVPQVVLPMWMDCYEFAARVEYLGVGIYANKTTAPEADAEELGEALLKVLDGGEEAMEMWRRAKSIADACNAYGGRKRAADKILELAESNYSRL